MIPPTARASTPAPFFYFFGKYEQMFAICLKGCYNGRRRRRREAEDVDIWEKLAILSDAAKYDAACTSSGVSRRGAGGLGNAVSCGICHSFAADGRCIALLKVLMSNACVGDCRYCQSRRSADGPRATFAPEELAELTISFYRRNYIEGLFLSSAIVRSPDYTMELMIDALARLRHAHGFRGYIHAKAIPGASPALVERLGLLADRLSVNIELPSEASLRRLAPHKTKASILAPMAQIRDRAVQEERELALYRGAPRFAPAGQSTQMIVGASPETDAQILRLTQGLYRKYRLRRVFYSAYIPVGDARALPVKAPPLLREHRLYQADWLLRFYGFTAEEILDGAEPMLDPRLDPKCAWALRHPERFPVDVNRAPLEEILRIPGVGVRTARRIVSARREAPLTFEGLKKLGVVIRRAQFFAACAGGVQPGLRAGREAVCSQLTAACRVPGLTGGEQLSLFDQRPQLLLGGI